MASKKAGLCYDLYRQAPENSQEAILFFDAMDCMLVASELNNRGDFAHKVRNKGARKYNKAMKLRDIRLAPFFKKLQRGRFRHMWE